LCIAEEQLLQRWALPSLYVSQLAKALRLLKLRQVQHRFFGGVIINVWGLIGIIFWLLIFTSLLDVRKKRILLRGRNDALRRVENTLL